VNVALRCSTATRESIFGIVSLIFWSATVVVIVTYAVKPFADDDGRVSAMLPLPTTNDGAFVEPRGCNRSQLVASEPARDAGPEPAFGVGEAVTCHNTSRFCPS